MPVLPLKIQLKEAIKRKLSESFFKLLPNKINQFAGSLGFSRYIKKTNKINFIRSVYKTKYKFLANASRNIDREAASNLIKADDPINFLKNINLKNSNVIDIGANIGTVSLAILSKGASKIYSFEPGPYYKFLENNIKINKITNRIIIKKIGFSNNEGKLYWAETKNNPGNAHLINSLDELNIENSNTVFNDESTFEEVYVSTLDIYFKKNIILNKLDLIKVDVEGMEDKVIEGGRELIRKFRPYVIIETNKKSAKLKGYDCITPIFDFFYNNQYKSYSLDCKGELLNFIYPDFENETLFVPLEREI